MVANRVSNSYIATVASTIPGTASTGGRANSLEAAVSMAPSPISSSGMAMCWKLSNCKGIAVSSAYSAGVFRSRRA